MLQAGQCACEEGWPNKQLLSCLSKGDTSLGRLCTTKSLSAHPSAFFQVAQGLSRRLRLNLLTGCSLNHKPCTAG